MKLTMKLEILTSEKTLKVRIFFASTKKISCKSLRNRNGERSHLACPPYLSRTSDFDRFYAEFCMIRKEKSTLFNLHLVKGITVRLDHSSTRVIVAHLGLKNIILGSP